MPGDVGDVKLKAGAGEVGVMLLLAVAARPEFFLAK